MNSIFLSKIFLVQISLFGPYLLRPLLITLIFRCIVAFSCWTLLVYQFDSIDLKRYLSASKILYGITSQVSSTVFTCINISFIIELVGHSYDSAIVRV